MIDNLHVGDNAELHALGLLEPRERYELEQHIAACPECQRRVGEAEEAAAQLVAPLTRIEPSPALRARVLASIASSLKEHPNATPLRMADVLPMGRVQRLETRLASERKRLGRLTTWGTALTAIAAVLAIALSITLFRTARLQSTLNGDDVALVQLVHSHFNHVSMTPTGATTLNAKIIYAKDGAWIYVVVDRPLVGIQVVALVSGAKRDFGSAEVRGGLATLFVRRAGKPSEVTLVYNGIPLANAALTY